MKRAEGPKYTSLGQRPREAGMSIVRGLKARPIGFIDRAFSPSVLACYNPGALPQAGMVRAFSADG
jgi:hypothetical protein